MKTNKLSTDRVLKLVALIIFIVWILPGVAKLIAANTLEIREDAYGVSLGMIYYRKHNSSSPTSAVRLTRIRGVDVKDYIDLGSGCIKDKESLVCHGRHLTTVDVDMDTFKIHKAGNLNSRYASDAEKVFCINNLREVNLKPDDLLVLSGKYAKDSEKAAFNCEVFVPKDISSLQYISDEFAKDNIGVYFQSSLISNADPKTFVVDDGLFNYSHDKNRFFKGDQEISKTEFTEHVNLLQKDS